MLKCDQCGAVDVVIGPLRDRTCRECGNHSARCFHFVEMTVIDEILPEEEGWDEFVISCYTEARYDT